MRPRVRKRCSFCGARKNHHGPSKLCVFIWSQLPSHTHTFDVCMHTLHKVSFSWECWVGLVFSRGWCLGCTAVRDALSCTFDRMSSERRSNRWQQCFSTVLLQPKVRGIAARVPTRAHTGPNYPASAPCRRPQNSQMGPMGPKRDQRGPKWAPEVFRSVHPCGSIYFHQFSAQIPIPGPFQTKISKYD